MVVRLAGGGRNDRLKRSRAERTAHDEDPEEQRQRYRELLEELRTVIPGVQVLFGFLLTVPFSSRFPELDELGVQVFAVALITVGLAAVVLMTPTTYHRLTPRHARHQRIRLGVRVAVSGMVLLAVAIGAAVFVVARFIFVTDRPAPAGTFSPTTIASVIAALVAGTAALLWFVVPLVRRDHVEAEESEAQRQQQATGDDG